MTTNKTSEENSNIEDLISEVMELVRKAMDSAMWAGECVMETDGSFEDKFNESKNIKLDVESKLREVLKEYSKDSKRLMFACEFDGYVTVEKDRYDYAIDCMEESSRNEPNEEDELNGLRRLVDVAMEVRK